MDPDDADGQAAEIAFILSHPAVAEKMKAESLAYVQLFSDECIAAAVRRAYDRALA